MPEIAFMAIDNVPALVDALKQCRLLESGHLSELTHTLQPRFSDPRALARELLERSWVTPFQVNRLFQGRSQDLVLGSYVLLEPLGEGGMGTVFKARHTRLDRIDALKLIRKNLLSNPTAVERFHREARAAARLSHPNVVTIYNADVVGDIHFLAMEYIAGTDLSRLVKQKGPLPVGLACEYIRQAAQGLQHAHERGLIHRDIKPGNLLVTSDGGTVKILDMGLARLRSMGAQEATAHSLTGPETVVGTADYIAPEQARNSRDLDIRADIYSLGCTLYFLLTGRVPFSGETVTEKLLMHQLDEPAPVEKLRPEVAPPLAAVVRKLMAKDPADRFRTPAEVAAALHPFASSAIQTSPGMPREAIRGSPPLPDHALALAGSVPTGDTVPFTPSALPLQSIRRLATPSRRHLFAVAAALVFVILAGALLWALARKGETAATRPGGSSPASRPDPAKALVHYQRGMGLAAERKFDQAITEFTEAARLDPKHYLAYFHRASCYFELGDHSKALADNTQAIQLEPRHAMAFHNRGTLLALKGQHDLAIADFSEAIRLNPRYGSAYSNRGRAYLDKGQDKNALADFTSAIEFDLPNAGNHNDRGVAYLRLKRYGEAIEDFTEAIRLSPKLGLAYLNRSRAHALNGNQPEADADFRRAVSLDPSLAKGKQ